MQNDQEATYPHQTLFGLPFFNGNVTQAVDLIWKRVLDNEFVTVATPNPEQIIQMKEYAPFAQAVQSFDVFLPDGQGIVWAARKSGKSLTERVPGVDVVKQLLEEMSGTDGLGLVIGGWEYDQHPQLSSKETPDVQVSKAAQLHKEREEKKYEVQHPEPLSTTQPEAPVIRFFPLMLEQVKAKDNDKKVSVFWMKNFDRNSISDTDMAIEWITKHRPMIVFVALGAPYQELWIAKFREQLNQAGVRCVMAVGGSFDILTGRMKRAPDIFQNMGLEWLWRLFQQPWRWKRQLRLIRFIFLTLRKR